MNAGEIRGLLIRKPFEPFRLCLSGGQAYEIRDPQCVALMKSRMFVALPDAERWVFVSYLHIVSAEAPGNGSARRKRRR